MARVHLSTVNTSMSATPSTFSAPSLMDLIHAENVTSTAPDSMAAMEELWFNNPDPYDLDESLSTCVDPALQTSVVRSSVRFDIAKYIKLTNPKLVAMITNVDLLGPGSASISKETSSTTTNQKVTGKPGEWSIENFLA